MGLDFITLGHEEYDFAMPKEFLDMDMISEFIKVIRIDEFKASLINLAAMIIQK